MAFLVDEAFLPATLTVPPMTDEQFAEFCAEHPDLFFEVTAEGELLVMPPNYPLTGLIHTAILRQLSNWAAVDDRGVVSDAASGFALPDGSRRSPDAAWTLKSRVLALGPTAVRKFWHLCPDFVVEVRSPHDRLRTLREKMQEWIDNGAAVAWMIDPEKKTVEIYRPGLAPESILSPDRMTGEGPVAGFVLEMRRVWDPLSA